MSTETTPLQIVGYVVGTIVSLNVIGGLIYAGVSYLEERAEHAERSRRYAEDSERRRRQADAVREAM